MRHTPGPWTMLHASSQSESADIVRADDTNDRVAMTCPDSTEGVEIANGCLIAAAPDLYEALRELNIWFSEAFDKVDLGHYKADVHKKFDKAKTAIAKAEGK